MSHPVTEVQDAIISSIIRKHHTVDKNGESVFVDIGGRTFYKADDRRYFHLLVARCEGGAWNSYGTGSVERDHILISVKSLRGIIYHKAEFKMFTFSYMDVDFLDKFTYFCIGAGVMAMRSFDLSHNRYWRKHRSYRSK
jgi:hypothetical protein